MTEVNWIARGGAFRTEYIYISREHHTIICVVQCIRWRQIKTSASRALYFMHIFERFLPFLSFVCVRCVYSQHTAEERTMRNARWGFIKGKISIYIMSWKIDCSLRLNWIWIEIILNESQNWIEILTRATHFEEYIAYVFLFLFTFQLFFGTMIRFLFDCSYNMYNGHIDGHCTCVWCMY